MAKYVAPEMQQCEGSCRQLKPVAGLGSDGRCLDCRLAPIQNAQPRLSWSQKQKMKPRQTAYQGEEYP